VACEPELQELAESRAKFKKLAALFLKFPKFVDVVSELSVFALKPAE
jgi:hypothetical protein